MLILVVSMPNVTITVPSGNSGVNGMGTSKNKKKTDVGPIVGGVIGSLGGAVLFTLVGLFFWRRARHTKADSERPAPTLIQRAFTQHNRPITFAVPYEYPAAGAAPSTHVPPSTSTSTSAPQLSEKARREARQYGQSVQKLPSSNEDPRLTVVSSDVEGTTSTSPTGALMSPVSPAEVRDLRTEVENLRRVVQNIQVDAAPPPTYYSLAADDV